MLPRVPRLSWVLADRWQDLWNRGAGCQRAVALRLTVFESPRRAVDQPAGVRSCGSADPHVLESDLGDREVAPISMATARRARALRCLRSGRWPNRSIPSCAEALPRDGRDVVVQRRVDAVEGPLDEALDDPLCVLLVAAGGPDDGRRHAGRLAVPGAVWATSVIVPAPLARASAFPFDACRCLGVGLSRPGRGPRRRPCPTPRASARGSCRPGRRRRWPSRARRRMPDLDARAQPHPLADGVFPAGAGEAARANL